MRTFIEDRRGEEGDSFPTIIGWVLLLLVVGVLAYLLIIHSSATNNALNDCQSKGYICAVSCPDLYNKMDFLSCQKGYVCCMRSSDSSGSNVKVVEGELHPK